MMHKKPSILFIGKNGDFYCERAVDFIKLHFPENTIILGRRLQPISEEVQTWTGDIIVSYLSPWILSESVLKNAKQARINFHPGPPDYPGIGCTNFALYHGEQTYGVTCHHMEKSVDTGDIIAVRRFPVLSDETVFSLTQRCYAEILVLFYEIMGKISQGPGLPTARESWTRQPFRRSQLDALCRLTHDMSKEEIQRRTRAVTYPNAPGAYYIEKEDRQ
jgi:methionyl-tRNA formyltransferase